MIISLTTVEVSENTFPSFSYPGFTEDSRFLRRARVHTRGVRVFGAPRVTKVTRIRKEKKIIQVSSSSSCQSVPGHAHDRDY